MAFRTKNRSLQFLVVTFNSGNTVHLAPQEVSETMGEIEVKGNTRLEKMKKNSLITIHEEKIKEERKIEEGIEEEEKKEEKKEKRKK